MTTTKNKCPYGFTTAETECEFYGTEGDECRDCPRFVGTDVEQEAEVEQESEEEEDEEEDEDEDDDWDEDED